MWLPALEWAMLRALASAPVPLLPEQGAAMTALGELERLGLAVRTDADNGRGMWLITTAGLREVELARRGQ